MRYLVTGGAGFVGSHVALALIEHGHHVTILDNLSTGHRAAIPTGAQFHEVDLLDTNRLNTILANGPWDGVLHFAALSLVGASMTTPYHYLRQNMLTSLNLIEGCVRYNVPRFLFSSTAALFNNQGNTPLSEDSPINPGSPYGESKFLIERALNWAERIHGLRYGCLRYFNAAGADAKGRLGEDHQPETHLIPLALDSALGRRPPLKLFGNDYPTPDGTCIRDYVHVSDLAEAHILTLNRLDTGSVTYNLGTGQGFSNLNILKAIETVTGRELPWDWAPRREGDPAILVTDPTRIRTELGWQPRYTKIEDIIETAFRWRLAHPNGYRGL
ncbi:UDP-glucose 4-epimerase GalE [Bombella sp. ESL0385]|uniref:UDP-glucose 4-epimerase GalE n=1 Tax=Bombella sp. ESL0385 TaxID=2676446 RepID=UPI0012D9DB43|nr:UDP-glucose 4-epimerase GalE [Bombella sp. ESL0385]MUG89407.1 UDP-glucose 4-epimerase GalE [Bombella sp. ESL0385]